MKQMQQNLDLARGDLMDMESLLCGGLAAFFFVHRAPPVFPHARCAGRAGVFAA